MSTGKYSPTINCAYATDQKWWDKNRTAGNHEDYYDDDGYDSYGYNKDEEDRAGYTELDYLSDSYVSDDPCSLYDFILADWGFYNGKPTLRSDIPKD